MKSLPHGITGGSDRWLRTPWYMYLLIGTVGLIVVGIVGFGFYKGKRINAIYAPLIDTTMEIRLEVTTAHLWLEEILGGDRNMDIGRVWKHLDRADWDMRAMIEGGKNQKGTLIPLDDVRMRREIGEMQEKLKDLKDIAKQRFAAKELSSPGTEIDQRYDAVFALFINQADKVERRLQRLMVYDLRTFQSIQAVLVTTCVFFFLSMGVALHWLDRSRITQYFLAIQETKEKKSEEQLRNLYARLHYVREEERTHIAREIHDELGQALTAVKMDLSWLNKKIPEDQELLLEKTQSMSKLVNTTLQTVKKIATELRPALLDDFGIAAAIEWQMEEFESRTGIKCQLTIDHKDIALDRDRSTVLFRVFQETLTNIARHANATVVKVSLKEEQGKVVLEVRDVGKGITERQISDPKSLGLLGMRERAHFVGGEFKISGIQDKGTTVCLSIPVDRKEGNLDDKNTHF